MRPCVVRARLRLARTRHAKENPRLGAEADGRGPLGALGGHCHTSDQASSQQQVGHSDSMHSSSSLEIRVRAAMRFLVIERLFLRS